MKKNKISQDLADLIQGKSVQPCISVIIPLHREPAFRKEDAIMVDHAMEKLGQLLKGRYDSAVVDLLMQNVQGVKEMIADLRGARGAGVFFSPALFRLIGFPFEVKEKIQVAESFE